MGVNFSAQLVMGMPVSENDFWETTGTKMVCPKRHEQASPDVKFCPDCGGKFESIDLVEPTEALKKFASDNGFDDHDVAWEQLQDRARDSGELGVICADPVQGGENDETSLVLGYHLATIGEGSWGSGRTDPTSFEELTVKRLAIQEAAKALGLPPKDVIVAAALHY
jgi:hypothetical protein